MSGYLLSISEILRPQPVMAQSQYALAQEAWLLQSRGLNVISLSDQTLNGTYPADNLTVSILAGVQHFIDRNGRFPGSSGEYIVPDISGKGHIFSVAISSCGSSPPPFSQLVYALQDFGASFGAVAILGTGSLPSSTVTIA